MNNRINTLHEKALRLVYTDKPNLSFDDLVKEDKLLKIHENNLKILATEIYKVKNDLGRKIMADIFHFVEKPYNLRNNYAKVSKPHSLFWNRKYNFSCSKTMGINSKRN